MRKIYFEISDELNAAIDKKIKENGMKKARYIINVLENIFLKQGVKK